MKEKERMLDKKISNLKSKKTTKKKSLQEKGITLIALVVTIIILLILAGVTLNIALSDNGLFSKTKEAAEKYKQTQREEEDMISQIAIQMNSEYIGAEVSGYNPSSNSEGCTVGTESTGCESQTFHTDENMTWRIWSFDGNKLEIIGEPTEESLSLNGATGYNNGVWVLDHICSTLYSNNKKDVSVRNLRRSDIQKVSNYDYTEYKHQKDQVSEDIENGTIQFGQSKEYENAHYPDMWDKYDRTWSYSYDNGNKSGTDKECLSWENIGTDEGTNGKTAGGTSKITLKESLYHHAYKKEDLISDKYWNLIYGFEENVMKDYYWLGTRFVHLDDRTKFNEQVGGKASFGICHIISYESGFGIQGSKIFDTDNIKFEHEDPHLRPFVTIDMKNSSCELVEKNDPVKGTYYELKWGEN